MKTIFLLLISISSFAQTVNGIKLSDGSTVKLVSDWEKHMMYIKFDSLYHHSFAKGSEFFVFFVELPKDHNGYNLLIQTSPKVTLPVAIDTVDSEALVYTDWTKHGPIADPARVPGWYKNTISYSTTGEAKYTFNGTGIELWAERIESHGTGSVTVGTQTKTVSWAGPKQLPAKIVEFKGLPQGQHTVTIKPVSGVVLIDFLVVVR